MSVEVIPTVVDPDHIEGTESMLFLPASSAPVEIRVEICDCIGVSVRISGMISEAESETGGRCIPLNRSTLETIISFRQVFRRFFAFLGFSRS